MVWGAFPRYTAAPPGQLCPLIQASWGGQTANFRREDKGLLVQEGAPPASKMTKHCVDDSGGNSAALPRSSGNGETPFPILHCSGPLNSCRCSQGLCHWMSH